MDFKNIRFCDNSVIIEDVKNFKLKQIFDCGQIFRFEEISEGDYIVIAFGKLIEIKEDNENIVIYNTNEEEFNRIWLKYFDLDRDYSKIKKNYQRIISLDKVLNLGME